MLQDKKTTQKSNTRETNSVSCCLRILGQWLMTKQTKWHVRPAKTSMKLGIRPVWSESLLSAWRKLGSSATHWAHSEDSYQTGRMPRLIWVFARRTCHFVGFVMRRRLICYGKIIITISYEMTEWGILIICHGQYGYSDRTRTVRTVWCIPIRSDHTRMVWLSSFFIFVVCWTKQKLGKEIEMILYRNSLKNER